jgi:hypothetical protein
MFWRIYSVALAVLLLPTYVMIMGTSYSLWDFMDMVVAVGALMGFIGFAYKFPIISVNVWKVYFFLVISWDFFYNIIITLVLDLAVHLPNEPKIGWTNVLLSFAIIAPEYVALFRYGFKSDPIWQE